MRGHRGQTTLDFAVGMSLFLLTVIFVFSFVPGMLGPFQSGPQEATVVADRVASQLVGTTLTTGSSQYLLNTTCTLAFFNETFDDTGCAFDNAQSVADRMGTDLDVNVTVRHDFDADQQSELVCWNGDALTACPDGWKLTAGPVPDSTEPVIVARRVCSLDDLDVEVFVRVW